jgi:hypothetical protein
MWVIYLEMGAVLVLVILILWFTLPRTREGNEDKDKR